MGTRYTVLFIIFAVGFLSSCATQTDGQRGIEIDQQPMYGGIDRKADPQLNAADEQLISGVTKEFGSREKASDAFVEQGTWFYKQDNYAMAMKRFNQAWLLNQDNPGAYWGFAVVYHDKGKNCDAKSMIDRALVLHLSNSIHLSDAGRIYTLCAVSDASLSQEVKSQYFAKSDDLYRKASGESSNNDYVFGSWAAYSAPNAPVIPVETSHLFQSKSATCSGVFTRMDYESTIPRQFPLLSLSKGDGHEDYSSM